MSMFRSAADISDSDPESSTDDFEYEDPSPGRNSSEQNRYAAGERILGSLGSMAGSDPGSYEKAQGSEDADEDAVLDVDAEGHATLMTSALLEFYCMTRAADILNSQQGSHGRYTRESPEVQYLGRKMYAYKSQFLSSHGVLANGIDSDDWGLTRQYYRDSLDVLGVSALEGMNLNGPLGPSIKGAITDSSLPSQTQDKQLMASTATHLQQPTVKETGGWDMKKRGFRGKTPGLVETRISFRGTPQPSPYLLSSSPAGFSLLDSPPPPQSPNRLSRYAVEFAEVKMLGRGSFGEVYHVRNHVDGQNYAIKKIPLSRRRLELLREGGLRQLEHIMKEIRTLARLEHTNVVRYYGAWVEQADGFANGRSLDNVRGAEHEPGHPSTDDSAESLISSFGGSDDGIIFAEDSKSEATNDKETSFAESSRRRGSHATITSNRSKKSSAHVEDDDDDVESIPRNFDASSRGLMSTMGGSDGDIFTDGLSEDRSRLQIRHRPRYGSQAPAVVLHIQMSLHPISLNTYLNPQSLRVPHGHSEKRRHCFHVIPSLKIILGILSGVEYLHSKGIVHRDLKPANIFLSFPEGKETSECQSCKRKRETPTYSCLPRIGDFGLVADISHISDSSPGTAVTSLQDNSKRLRHVGTEFYCPPIYSAMHSKENADHSSDQHPEADNPYVIDEKLDVFALGVILFELIYRLNTKMERQFVLADLTRGQHVTGRQNDVLPSDFCAKVDCGDMTMGDGTSVAEALSECIKGMVNPQRQKRWPCKDVRNCLECILSVVEKNLESY
ncbi:hypothetical protein DTO021C3_799 [Paecilomyces variotii]|nr:hypothetical protein DTO169C6_3086 [Paecilomyces variotii]KAJ9265844.1 hypothetical protein DTO195F2_1446 [Paecilomyces variotii]KAJ9291442.1 hypothetical protein DTO021C3_799 [Paecilomyces variotii]KAJ9402727.1 hypothetical protein DTO282F9_137 [Paecilomyces variotii]